jgi:thymidylate kinase
MAIRQTRIIAVEGAHGTGKSTLVHALAAHYKSRDVHATALAEVARQSPFVEDVVIHGSGGFDISAELHLFGSQIAHEQSLARHHELVICDKTIANVLGYSLLLLQSAGEPFVRDMVAAMEVLCRIYAKQYDLVFYVSDLYELGRTNDPFRPREAGFQQQADEFIRRACRTIGLNLLEIPAGLSLVDKVAWVVERADAIGLRR